MSGAEMRSQLTSLKTLIDACPTNAEMQSYVLNNTSGSAAGVGPLSLVSSNPPTAAELDQVMAKLNDLIAALNREPPS